MPKTTRISEPRFANALLGVVGVEAFRVVGAAWLGDGLGHQRAPAGGDRVHRTDQFHRRIEVGLAGLGHLHDDNPMKKHAASDTLMTQTSATDAMMLPRCGGRRTGV
jgi:hypothetical protein